MPLYTKMENKGIFLHLVLLDQSIWMNIQAIPKERQKDVLEET